MLWQAWHFLNTCFPAPGSPSARAAALAATKAAAKTATRDDEFHPVSSHCVRPSKRSRGPCRVDTMQPRSAVYEPRRSRAAELASRAAQRLWSRRLVLENRHATLQKPNSATAACALEAKQGLVDDVFHKVADRYDLMNDLMSGGLHRLWKDMLVAKVAPPRHRPYRHLDVAGGTGDVAFRVARGGRRADASHRRRHQRRDAARRRAARAAAPRGRPARIRRGATPRRCRSPT